MIDKSQVDTCSLHSHFVLQPCLNNTFKRPGRPKGGMVDEPEINLITWAKFTDST